MHIAYETQQRTVKDSGHWYREFLGGQPLARAGVNTSEGVFTSSKSPPH